MAIVILLAALTFGAPLINSGGLSWDNSAAIARFNTKVEIDRQREITRRIESDNWHATAQQVAIVAGVVGVVGALAWATQRSVTAWAARPHRPVVEHRQLAAPPSHIVIVAKPWLSAMRDSDLERPRDGLWYHGRRTRFTTLRINGGNARRPEPRPVLNLKFCVRCEIGAVV